MKVPAKIDYACKALLELSLHWPNETPLPITVISKHQQIPLKFLTQILLTLKQLGLVNSTRGKCGGYLLSQAPRLIKLSDVMRGFGGMGFAGAPVKEKPAEHVMDGVWQDMDEVIVQAMDDVNFEIIRERSRSKEHVIMYGI